MSRAAKFTLVGSIVLSGLTIWGVHFLQEWERNTMYQGVLRDDERRKEKMRQRQAEFELSRKRRELFEGAQSVSSNSPVSRSEATSNQAPG